METTRFPSASRLVPGQRLLDPQHGFRTVLVNERRFGGAENWVTFDDGGVKIYTPGEPVEVVIPVETLESVVDRIFGA